MKPKFLSRFTSSAGLLPYMLDIATDQITVAEFSEDHYKSASFLDQRAIHPQIPRGTTSWSDLSEATSALTGSPDMIFHIGHVGSTLVSRLLGELNGVLSLREPLLLRSLAEVGETNGTALCPWSEEQYRQRTAEALVWLSRSFRPDQTALIKASSFVSAIADDLLPHIGSSIALYVPPERYIATILAGDNSRQELAHLSAQRLARLHRNISGETLNLWQCDEAMRAAMSWATEMTSLVKAAGSGTDTRILWVDFEKFLNAPESMLEIIAEHYSYSVSQDKIAALTSGPLMQSYSKAPEHKYSKELREELLTHARRDHAAEIAAALSWLEQAGREHDLIGRALNVGEKK